MGFNKRYVNGQSIMAHFASKGIKGVQDYFSTPDALIVPQNCWATIVEQAMDLNDLTALLAILEQGTQDHNKLVDRALNLKKQISLNPELLDGQLIEYLTQELQDIDTALSYYR
jgi:hypothetical protein